MNNKQWKRNASCSDGITETHCFGVPKEIVGFCLLFSGVFLLIGSLFFVKYGQTETNDMLVPFEKNSTNKQTKHESYKKKFIIKKPKISIKKQIYVSLNLKKQLESNLNQLLRSWVTDSLSSDRISEISIFTDSSLPIETVPVRKVNQVQDNDDDKYLTRLLASLKFYNSKSRALWFLDASATTYINIEAMPFLTDNILSQKDPIKEEIVIGNCITSSSCAVLMSRAAAKKYISTGSKQELVSAIHENKSLSIGMFSGSLNDSTAQLLQSQSKLIKCQQETNLTRLSECSILHLDENSFPPNPIIFNKISNGNSFVGYDEFGRISICEG